MLIIYYQPGPGVHTLGSEYEIGELPGRFDHLTCHLQADSSVSCLSELTATSQKIDDE
jgi:hypothetical protein